MPESSCVASARVEAPVIVVVVDAVQSLAADWQLWLGVVGGGVVVVDCLCVGWR